MQNNAKAIKNLLYLANSVIEIEPAKVSTAPVVHPFTVGLEAYWRLEENIGSNRLDATGNGHTLTESIGLTRLAAVQGFGATFGAVGHLDGSSIPLAGTSFTIAGWFYCGFVGYSGLVGHWDYTSNNRGYLVFIDDNSGTPLVSLRVSADGTLGTANSVLANSFGAVTAGAWIQFIAWYDSVAQTINVQVNNSVVDSVPHLTGVFGAAATFCLGDIAADNAFIVNGSMDEVGIWTRVLTAAERLWLYNGGAGRSYAEIIAA